MGCINEAETSKNPGGYILFKLKKAEFLVDIQNTTGILILLRFENDESRKSKAAFA